ncbi:MAG: isftu1, partial [Labilithrix sp.]|nr:isftu1 [Labilithrix sp.]
YKARADVECAFNLLKQARRFARRYEKTLRNYAAVVAIGCALLWLRIGRVLFAALSQLDQHRHHADQHLLAGLVSSFIEQLESETHIEQRRRLRRGASRRQVVPPLVRLGVLAYAFGKIRTIDVEALVS